MNIKVVLFDLDGTLLPMNQEEFIKCYFKLLAQRLAPHGYEPERFMSAIWSGIAAMVRNDGVQSNAEVFWKAFAAIFGDKVYEDKPLFDAFYQEDFQRVKAVCGYNPQAARVVQTAKEKGLRVGLATNPLFPAVATESRIRWAGLSPEDFELYTTYENASSCKPNPHYYRDILKRMKVSPEECLMVGNDVSEDMIAQTIGMRVFLLTDCLINKEGSDIAAYPHGGFSELTAFICAL